MPAIESIVELAQVQAGNTATLVYAAPDNPTNCVVRITSMWICNTDTAERQVTLRKGLGTLTAANSLLDAAALSAKTTWWWEAAEGVITLQAGRKLEIFSDVAAKVTITIEGKIIQ